MLKKKKMAGFLDKAKDSQEVANLVEELRSAIMYYQVSGNRAVWTRVDMDRTALTTTVDVSSNWKPDHKCARKCLRF